MKVVSWLHLNELTYKTDDGRSRIKGSLQTKPQNCSTHFDSNIKKLKKKSSDLMFFDLKHKCPQCIPKTKQNKKCPCCSDTFRGRCSSSKWILLCYIIQRHYMPLLAFNFVARVWVRPTNRCDGQVSIYFWPYNVWLSMHLHLLFTPLISLGWDLFHKVTYKSNRIQLWN